MAWPEGMSSNEESYVRQMVEDMHHAVQSIDRVLRGHNGDEGLLTKLSHVKRTAEDNDAALRKLEKRLDKMTVQPGNYADTPDMKFWGKVGALVVVIGVVLEGLKYVFGG